ncbi:DUF6088 family protein [Solitalea lacus]|uniref:DUF6088 family protein n=1 Tax=Solitalea lacus TaxID=2911172 RepID=UPI001EDB4A1A|nr:DUF6088 family protein [Solitalea lacus]UKJ09240.1 DUF6088 family protein [Solitalea lacus]
MESTHQVIAQKIKKLRKGKIIYPTDFRGIGTTDSVKKALSRLTKDGVIRRAAHGIYYLPKIDPLIGELKPTAEEIAQSIAEKEHIKIKPAGSFAMNKLGISTQVPMNLVYMTDGSPRDIKVGKKVIKFKKTTPKKMALKGKYSSLVIQALEELNIDEIEKETQRKIIDILNKESIEVIRHDLSLSSQRINDYFIFLFNLK